MLKLHDVVYYILGSHIQCGHVSKIAETAQGSYFQIDTYVVCDEENWIAEEEIGRSVFLSEAQAQEHYGEGYSLPTCCG